MKRVTDKIDEITTWCRSTSSKHKYTLLKKKINTMQDCSRSLWSRVKNMFSSCFKSQDNAPNSFNPDPDIDSEELAKNLYVDESDDNISDDGFCYIQMDELSGVVDDVVVDNVDNVVDSTHDTVSNSRIIDDYV